ncbi:hypothetical protein M6D81_28725 [Paenibacillus sp. J5C_2022]|uniref:hypothetical protein n=1 Tax=Paenibacillus sp. J5C2022 TaxID=2977129 RepID=UPI0021D195FB|nr:hypothetical protein [Paenibacillus sp. J5C2022]MCU6712691.1 hypothetical protein [Paenibacillus sp. J5C2022]
MFTLKEKIYLLQMLKKSKRRSFWRLKKRDNMHAQLVEKLEQMVRNEQVNKEHL